MEGRGAGLSQGPNRSASMMLNHGRKGAGFRQGPNRSASMMLNHGEKKGAAVIQGPNRSASMMPVHYGWHFSHLITFCSRCNVQEIRVGTVRRTTVRPTLLRQIDMGSFTCAHISVRAVHAKGGGGCVGGWGVGVRDKSACASVVSEGQRKTVYSHHPAPPWARAQGLGN